MNCPKCKQRTEVLEVGAHGSDATRRRRSCTGCKHRFSTIEVTHEYRRRAAPVIRGTRLEPEVLQAMLNVDQRKKKIARDQRARERYDDEHAPPRRLGRGELRRELKGHW